MKKGKVRVIISRLTYDKCFFQKTVLNYYCGLKDVARTLEEKFSKNKKSIDKKKSI